MLDLTNDKRLLYALIFKNVGESAGASLEHTHSQLICTPIVPKRVQEEMFRCEEYESFHDRCLFCDIIEQDISVRDRVVMNSENFLAVMAYASRFPFETWILPKQHISHFEHTPPGMLAELAKVLREVLCRIDVSLDDPPYNYMLHTSPMSMGPVAYYHWHLEVIPRVTRVAGFEWGTGFYINPVVPEEAARYLREVTLEEPQSKAANVPAAKPVG
jgi:UDPglucose--hexose-1-phosphate uridylyltransferase